jgi:hypothetical protein
VLSVITWQVRRKFSDGHLTFTEVPGLSSAVVGLPQETAIAAKKVARNK